MRLYKNKIFFVFILLCGSFLFSSCIFIPDILDNVVAATPNYVPKTLSKKFGGEFKNKKMVAVPSNLKYTYGDYISAYYSTALDREIMVSKYSKDFIETNYLFLKYEDELDDAAETVMAQIVSDFKILIDFEWFFTDQDENDECMTYLKGTMQYKDFSVVIHAEQDEYENLEDVIKAITYALTQKCGYKGKIMLYVAAPENEIDVYNVNISNLHYKKYSFDHIYSILNSTYKKIK